MKSIPKHITLGAGMLAASLAYYLPAQANNYPSEPVRIIVPYTAGATNDAVPRIIGPKLSEILGQPVVVENRPGAGGDIGVTHVVKSKPDGHTLLMTSNAAITREVTSAKPAYELAQDMQPIMLVGDQPMILVVATDFEADSVKELIAAGRANPEGLSYATPGAGTPHHLAAELLSDQAGIELLHIPYKGTAASLVDTAAERVTMTWATQASAGPMLEANKVKAIAITSPERLPSMPDLPTFAEAGINGLTSGFSYGFMAPKGTPDAVVEQLYQAFKQAIQDPEVEKQITDLGIVLKPLAPQEYAELVESDHAQWKTVAESANISIQP